MQRRREISRVVGLSTEFTPTMQRRPENPAIRNMEVDVGGVARSRDGYERLSTEALKDSSWRLRGAPYHPTLFQEYHDSLIIPHDSRYNVSSEKFFVSGIIEFSPSGVSETSSSSGVFGTLITTNHYSVICKGKTTGGSYTRSTDMSIMLYLDYSGGWRWNLHVVDDPSTVIALQVSDSGLTDDSIGQIRYFEFGNLNGTSSNLQLRIYDVATGSQVGSTATSTSLTNLKDTDAPWVVGAYVDDTGFPVNTDQGGSQPQGWLNARVAEIRLEMGFSSAPTLVRTADNGIIDRELRPTEYADSNVQGYFPCTDGAPPLVRDACDVTGNTDYAAAGGSNEANHGRLGNTAPQWIDRVNDILVNAGQNADVSNVSGIELINRFGIYFSGVDGIAVWRSTTPNVPSSGSGNALVTTFSQTPAAGVGWTVELCLTLLMEPGETTYPERILYASSDESNGAHSSALNPITIGVNSSGQFYCSFITANAGSTTYTATITTAGRLADDFVGEKVTLVATRNNNTLSFWAIGENKSDATASTAVASVPTMPSSSPENGPFVMIGRKVDAFASGTNRPSSYTSSCMYGVFHEYRLWSLPADFATASARANAPVGANQRQRLSVYLVPEAGSGNKIQNFGTSHQITWGGFTSQIHPEDADSRMYPRQGSGPVTAKGLVDTYRPVRCWGMKDFQRSYGGKTMQDVVVLAGSSLYSFDPVSNVLTWEAEGVIKTDQLASMVVFDDRLYIANGGPRVLVWDGTDLRNAGIEPPVEEPTLTTGTGGSIADGIYVVGYRYVNSRAGVYSNMSPITEITVSSGVNDEITSIGNIEPPSDPQVDAIEIFVSITGDASVMYRLEVPERGILDDVTAGSWTPSSSIDGLTTDDVATFLPPPVTVTNFAAEITTIGDLHRFSPPPPSTAIALFGDRMLYALRDAPESFAFSRTDGGIQLEHLNLTPGFESTIRVATDSGDAIRAMTPYLGSVVIYLQNARAEVRRSGINTQTTGFEIPFSVSLVDRDRGTVSPASVANLKQGQMFFDESDIFFRRFRDEINVTSPSEDVTNPARPRIGRTIRALDGDFLKRVVAAHCPDRQQVWFAVTQNTGTASYPSERNDTILVYSYRDRKWTLWRAPAVDYIEHVEVEGDRRSPLAVVSGYIVKFGETGGAVDSYDASFVTGETLTVGSVSGNVITCSGAAQLTAGAARFRPAWIGASGVYYLYLVLDNDLVSGGSVDELHVIPLDGGTPVADDSIYLGSINPSIDFNLGFSDATRIKRFRSLDVAMQLSPGDVGTTDFELSMWLDEMQYDPTPATAQIRGRSLSVGASDQFMSTDIGGSGRYARLRLSAPQPGKRLSLSEIAIHFETPRARGQKL